MTAVLGVFAVAAALAAAPPALDPQHLPQLPSRGLVHEAKIGVELQTMRGRPLSERSLWRDVPDAGDLRGPLGGRARLQLRTPRFASYWMWGA